jgi:hypothetical protein
MRISRNSLVFCLTIGLWPVVYLKASGVPAMTVTSRADSSGTVFTDEGTIEVKLRELHVEGEGARKSRPLSVLIIYEPRSGAYSWQVSDADLEDKSWRIEQFKETQAAYLRDGQFVDFWAVQFRLFVREYGRHASGMDDAEAKALQDVNLTVDPLGYLEKAQNVHEVSLANAGFEFINAPMSVSGGPSPRVTAVQWDGKKWIVTLRGRWTEEISLDANYKLSAMKKLSEN